MSQFIYCIIVKFGIQPQAFYHFILENYPDHLAVLKKRIAPILATETKSRDYLKHFRHQAALLKLALKPTSSPAFHARKLAFRAHRGYGLSSNTCR